MLNDMAAMQDNPGRTLRPMKDSLGETVHVGDHVAYIQMETDKWGKGRDEIVFGEVIGEEGGDSDGFPTDYVTDILIRIPGRKTAIRYHGFHGHRGQYGSTTYALRKVLQIAEKP
jgi:hypothetical protein